MSISEQLHAANVPNFPCWTQQNPQTGRWNKGPAVPKGTSWADVARHPELYPSLNWAATVVGVPIPDGVLIIDLDRYKGVTREAVEAAVGVQLPWDRAFIQTTISGGEHYAFQCTWDVKQGDSLLGLPGFDTRTAGKGFICTGQGYTPAGPFGVAALGYPAALPEIPDAARVPLERHEPTIPTTPQALPQNVDVDQVAQALHYVDPGCPRAEWVRMGLALRSHFQDDETTGLALFGQWSAGEFWPNGTPENYVGEHIEGQWNSFKPEGGTTIATLFYRAIQSGWTPPSTFDTAAAFGTGAAAADTFDQLVERVRVSGGDVKQTPAILDEIRAAGCNSLQVALLAAELKNALKDAGVKDAQVGKSIDLLLVGRELPRQHPGTIPQAGQYLDDNTPLHPDAWAPMQTKGKDMKPKGTLRNFEIMLGAYGVSIEFDEIRKTLRMTGPTMPGAGVLHEEAALAYLDSLANLNEYPVPSVKSMIMPIANKHTVNPVAQYVQSAPWDGQDHVGQLWGQITLEPDEDTQFCETLFRKWLRGAYGIGTGYLDRWEFVMVLIDPNGGAGKTRFFSTLCPRNLQTDSVILDTSNKDSVKMAISYWLTELGELDGTFSRSDSARLKAFLSLQRDEMRLPYGRSYLEYPRRTAFFASVNETHFLIDPSDNRRFWGMKIADANHAHDVNLQQVWAQAAAEFHAGHIAHLTPNEDQILRMRNESFRSGSPIVDALGALTLTPGAPEDHKTVSEILALAGMSRPNKGDLNEAARWLRRAGFRETKRGGRRGFQASIEARTAAAFTPQVHEGGKV